MGCAYANYVLPFDLLSDDVLREICLYLSCAQIYKSIVILNKRWLQLLYVKQDRFLRPNLLTRKLILYSFANLVALTERFRMNFVTDLELHFEEELLINPCALFAEFSSLKSILFYHVKTEVRFLNFLPDSLTSLRIHGAKTLELDGIAQKMPKLKIFNVQYVRLAYLPDLPTCLIEIICPHAKLLALPSCLPHGLQRLNCKNNKITSLPPLPDSLVALNCGNNQLKILPTLPDSLLFLICNQNDLFTLPALPSRLRHLMCANNPNLSYLPPLPRSLTFVNFRGTSLQSGILLDLDQASHGQSLSNFFEMQENTML